ncbi:MAG: hypothetical protein H6981_01560 [Gammaproteobacteria bacterium]|nr:hypothetical protein [Gammaproteobacteria bacterium]MCP5135474.1 hypothetical protein [Gammaproteobacteria bacterium]
MLVATSIGLGLLLIIYGFLLHSMRMSEIMIGRVQLNAEARLGFDMLANGGVVGGNRIAGLHGNGDLNAAVLDPSGGTIGRLAQKLVIDGGANGLLESTELQSEIQCVGVNDPHPDCVAAGSATVTGYLAATPVVDPGVRNLTVTAHCQVGTRPATAEVGLELIDPHFLGSNESFTADQYRAEFHNVFAFHVDCL